MLAQRGAVNILEVMDRLSRWFRPADAWDGWKAFLAALFGLPMSTPQAMIYARCTGRTTLPEKASNEAALIVGRRGGKSRISALVAVFLALFRDYSKYLAAGERGTIMVIAADRKEARAVFGYIEGFIDGDELLRGRVLSRTKDAIVLDNQVTIEVHTANFRAVRGYTIIAAICDEIAFWRSDESANPDSEILNGIRPGMSTIPNGLLLYLSSPYARKGVLWDAYERYYSKDGAPVLVWKADTATMNPTVDRGILEDAYAKDPIAAAAEYGGEFRKDVESFVSREAVAKAIVPGRTSLPCIAGWPYYAFVDPSGGSADSFTLGIAHHDKGRLILDALVEWRAPFEPDGVVREACDVVKRFKLTKVTGDHYAGEWPRDRFKAYGVSYLISDATKSEIYRDVLPYLNSGQVELLEIDRLKTQLLGLERRVTKGGREIIDHLPGAQDDVINAAAGALRLAGRIGSKREVEKVEDPPQTLEELRRREFWQSNEVPADEPIPDRLRYLNGG